MANLNVPVVRSIGKFRLCLVVKVKKLFIRHIQYLTLISKNLVSKKEKPGAASHGRHRKLLLTNDARCLPCGPCPSNPLRPRILCARSRGACLCRSTPTPTPACVVKSKMPCDCAYACKRELRVFYNCSLKIHLKLGQKLSMGFQLARTRPLAVSPFTTRILGRV